MAREMKDSGVQWIGEIPTSWQKCKLKNIATFQSGSNLTSLVIDKQGDYLVYGGNGIRGFYSKYSHDGEYLLIGRQGALCGNVHYVNTKFWATEHAITVQTKKSASAKWAFYLVQIMNLGQYSQASAQPGLAVEKIVNLKTILPSLTEQNAIVAYLDKECTEIDRVIEKTKATIAEYKKYKQSVITEAVTKGLNPNAEMKNSSIEWIGELPNHWKVVKLKYMFSINKRIANTLEYDILSVTQNGLKIKDISNNEGQISSDYSKYQIVEPNDFVMNHMDLLTGGVDCSNFLGVTSPDYRVFTLNKTNICNRKYYVLIFQLCYRHKIFYGLGQGVSNLGRWRLQTDKFINFELPIPPLSEQSIHGNS